MRDGDDVDPEVGDATDRDKPSGGVPDPDPVDPDLLEDDLLEGELTNGDPVDLAALWADDDLVDGLAAGLVRTGGPSGGGDDELVSMLAAWVDEVRPDPDHRDLPPAVPADPPTVELPAVVASPAGSPIAAVRPPSPPRHTIGARYARRLAMAAALLVLASGGLAVGASQAEPGEALWAITKVFYAEHARSVEAAADVSAGLETARVALREGRRGEAAVAIASVTARLGAVRPTEGRDVLVMERQQLLAVLAAGGPIDPDLLDTLWSASVPEESGGPLVAGPATGAPGPANAAFTSSSGRVPSGTRGGNGGAVGPGQPHDGPPAATAPGTGVPSAPSGTMIIPGGTGVIGSTGQARPPSADGSSEPDIAPGPTSAPLPVAVAPPSPPPGPPSPPPGPPSPPPGPPSPPPGPPSPPPGPPTPPPPPAPPAPQAPPEPPPVPPTPPQPPPAPPAPPAPPEPPPAPPTPAEPPTPPPTRSEPPSAPPSKPPPSKPPPSKPPPSKPPPSKPPPSKPPPSKPPPSKPPPSEPPPSAKPEPSSAPARSADPPDPPAERGTDEPAGRTTGTGDPTSEAAAAGGAAVPPAQP